MPLVRPAVDNAVMCMFYSGNDKLVIIRFVIMHLVIIHFVIMQQKSLYRYDTT